MSGSWNPGFLASFPPFTQKQTSKGNLHTDLESYLPLLLLFFCDFCPQCERLWKPHTLLLNLKPVKLLPSDSSHPVPLGLRVLLEGGTSPANTRQVHGKEGKIGQPLTALSRKAMYSYISSNSVYLSVVKYSTLSAYFWW